MMVFLWWLKPFICNIGTPQNRREKSFELSVAFQTLTCLGWIESKYIMLTSNINWNSLSHPTFKSSFITYGSTRRWAGDGLNLRLACSEGTAWTCSSTRRQLGPARLQRSPPYGCWSCRRRRCGACSQWRPVGGGAGFAGAAGGEGKGDEELGNSERKVRWVWGKVKSSYRCNLIKLF